MDLTVTSGGSASINDSTAIQVALDAIGGAGGGTLTLPSANYWVQTSLQVWSNTNVLGARGTIHRRITNGADIHATIRNKNPIAGGDVNITVRNLRLQPDSSSFPGKQIVFEQVNGVIIERVVFGEVFSADAWLIFLRNVDQFKVRQVSGTAGTLATQAGIQCGGCRHGLIEDIGPLYVGDDVIALVNELYADGHSVLREMYDITVRYSVDLHSVLANIIKVVVGTSCTAAIHDVKIYELDGTAGGEGINVYDQNLDSLIYRVDMKNVRCDCSTNTAPGIQIKGVRDSKFLGVRVKEPLQRAEIDGCNRCEFNIDVTSPRQATNQCILVGDTQNCTDLKFSGGRLRGGQWGLYIGGATGEVTNWSAESLRIQDCVSNGLVLFRAFNGVAQPTNQITGCGDKAAEEFNDSDLNVVYTDRFTGQDNPADNVFESLGAASVSRTFPGGRTW